MFLQRLNAIVTGLLAIALGSGLVTFLGKPFGEELAQAQRQREVVGSIVGQQAKKVCKPRPHTSFRSTPRECKDWMTVQCPIVQYQPETGEPLKFTDCSVRTLVNPETQIYVIYDAQVPTLARIMFDRGTNYHWHPVFLLAIPLGIAGLWIVMGVFKLRQGFQHPS
jgi:hypothetical protein